MSSELKGSAGYLKLLVSVVDERDAVEAVKGGADIVDVKNPAEGSLGANFPWIIRQVRRVTPKNVEVSATVGDLPNLPGTASLASLGAAIAGAEYVKAGLYGARDVAEGVELMKSMVRAVREWLPKVRVIAAGYADYRDLGCLNPWRLTAVAQKAEADGVMIDVKRKDSRKLFHYLHPHDLKEFVRKSHSLGLTVALAGSLGPQEVAKALELDADIIGVRRAACKNGGRVSKFLVTKLSQVVKGDTLSYNL